MCRSTRLFAELFLAAATMALIAGSVVAFAGEDDDLVEKAPARTEQGRPFQRNFAARRNVANLETYIDRWVYGNRRNGGERRQTLHSLLQVKIEEITRAAGISEAQKQRLMLAGEGDVRRFDDRLEEIKNKYRNSEFNRNTLMVVMSEIRPLRTQLRAGLFAGDSLLAKSLARTLTADQVARMEAAERERRQYQYRAEVELTVMRLSASLGLNEKQRKRLTSLLLEKTRPLEAADGMRSEYAVLVQMYRMPESELKPVFDAGQWRALQRQFVHVPQMIAMLRHAGIKIDVDEPRREQPLPAAKPGERRGAN